MPIGVDIIPHKWYLEIIKKIDDLRASGYAAANTEAQMIRGPTRVGKSVLVQKYAAASPPVETEDGWVRPVILITASRKGTSKSLSEALLAQLGDPAPSRGTEAGMVERIKYLGREQKTELIIIDEVHDAMRGDLYAAGDFFKDITNWNLCPLLLVGLPHAIDFFKENEQLRGRDRPVIDFKAFDWSGEHKKVFRQILKTFQGMLSKEITSIALWDEPVAARLNYASWGALGLLTRLLSEAERLAKDDPKRELTLDVLIEAYENFQNQEPETFRRLNPFKKNADMPVRWSSGLPGGKFTAKSPRRRSSNAFGIGAE